MSSVSASHLRTIARYYDGCSRGDIAAIKSTLHADVVHYFLEPNPKCRPITGADRLAVFWQDIQRQIDGHWLVDHSVSNGYDEAVVEWSLYWRRDPASPRIVTRGSEWFAFDGSLIVEIRSYYQQLYRDTGLCGYPYGERGYSLPGSESSNIHVGIR